MTYFRSDFLLSVFCLLAYFLNSTLKKILLLILVNVKPYLFFSEKHFFLLINVQIFNSIKRKKTCYKKCNKRDRKWESFVELVIRLGWMRLTSNLILFYWWFSLLHAFKIPHSKKYSYRSQKMSNNVKFSQKVILILFTNIQIFNLIRENTCCY